MDALAKLNNGTEIVLPSTQFTPVGWTPDRELSYEEWEAIGDRLSRVGAAVNWWIGDWINYGERKYGEKYAQALALFDGQFDYSALAKLASIARNIKSLRRNKLLSWSHHYEVAKLDDDAQSALLNLAENNHLSVRDLREAVRAYKRNLYLEEKGADIRTVNIEALPKGIYRIIYADPPWDYGNSVMEGSTRPTNYYPTMPTEEIAALPVYRLSADDSVLFLWSTSPHLPEAMDVIEAWGFEYKTSFVWDKVKHNMGHYNSVRHELLLVCTRGSCPPDVQRLHDSVVVQERTEHSAKPGIFRQIIDELYVYGRRVELFARTSSDGWDSWGNELS